MNLPEFFEKYLNKPLVLSGLKSKWLGQDLNVNKYNTQTITFRNKFKILMQKCGRCVSLCCDSISVLKKGKPNRNIGYLKRVVIEDLKSETINKEVEE